MNWKVCIGIALIIGFMCTVLAAVNGPQFLWGWLVSVAAGLFVGRATHAPRRTSDNCQH